MRIVYMGTPDFAVPCLEALVSQGMEVIGVVTQPDRPKGRGRQLAPSPVKQKALELGLPVYQPEKVKTPEFVAQLKELRPDIIIVVAFGQILSVDILELPPYGCVNVHASLLPKYRGAAPIHWSVIDGEKQTGITTMYMDKGLDTGDMIFKEQISIELEDTVGEVHDRLAKVGAALLVKTVEAIEQGTAPRTPQNHSEATYAVMLKREHEQIDWSQAAEHIHNQIRGMNPWPGAFTTWGAKILKVWKAERYDQDDNLVNASSSELQTPGLVRAILPGRGLVVQTGNGCLLLAEIQLQGSRKMMVDEFIRGHAIQPGNQLGQCC